MLTKVVEDLNQSHVLAYHSLGEVGFLLAQTVAASAPAVP